MCCSAFYWFRLKLLNLTVCYHLFCNSLLLQTYSTFDSIFEAYFSTSSVFTHPSYRRNDIQPWQSASMPNKKPTRLPQPLRIHCSLLNNAIMDGDHDFLKAHNPTLSQVVVDANFIKRSRLSAIPAQFTLMTMATRTALPCFSWALMPFSLFRAAYRWRFRLGVRRRLSEWTVPPSNTGKSPSVWCHWFSELTRAELASFYCNFQKRHLCSPSQRKKEDGEKTAEEAPNLQLKLYSPHEPTGPSLHENECEQSLLACNKLPKTLWNVIEARHRIMWSHDMGHETTAFNKEYKELLQKYSPHAHMSIRLPIFKFHSLKENTCSSTHIQSIAI